MQTFQNLLVCPTCRSLNSLQLNESLVICKSCNSYFEHHNNVIDFVNKKYDTALNTLEYDLQKSVTFEASTNMFCSLKSTGNGALKENLGNVLEVGCGTGLLTLGMLAKSKFTHAVVTDISLNMLSVCRERVNTLMPELKDRITFASYSGKEPIFPDNAFDTCIANSVLHHIFDYSSFLSSTRRLLKSGGVAIFVEPATVFHEALTLSLSDAIVSICAVSPFPYDLRILAAWVEQTRHRLRCSLIELANYEDKHHFSRRDLADKCKISGFSFVAIEPINYDPLGMHAASNYQRELGIPDEFIDLIMPFYQAHAEFHFKDILINDMSEMYFISFHV